MTLANKYSVVITNLLWLFLNSTLCSQISFRDITSDAGIDHYYLGINEMGSGAAFFDLDNDGDQDLWLSGGLNEDALYENDGSGYFVEISEIAGLGASSKMVTTGVITGDLDNDGFKDVLVITHRGFANVLFRNLGNKTFKEVPESGLADVRAYSLAAAMADVNHDGYLDIYAGHYIEKDQLNYSIANPDSIVGFSHRCYSNKLYLNNGDFTFTETADTWQAADPGCALATAFTDYDGDYDADILVANDFGQWIVPNALLENRVHGFVDVSTASNMDVGVYGMGIAIGDYDNDLDLDYYITNLGENVLLNNNGDGTFVNFTEIARVSDTYVHDDLFATGWGTAFVDFDNDSDLDLYVVNGYVPSADFIKNAKANPNRCFENLGQGTFNSILNQSAAESPERGRGLACADIDNDGDVDFLVANVNKQATSDTIQAVQLYRNETKNGYRWLKISLEGSLSNRDGIGSQIRIKADGKWYLQEANGGYGTHASQHSNIVHFGLGTVEIVDSIVVYWPGGNKQVLTDVLPNQMLQIQEAQLTNHLFYEEEKMEVTVFPNPSKGDTHIQYQLSQPTNITLDIFDELGKRLFQIEESDVNAGLYTLNWPAPHSGIFFLRLKSKYDIAFKTICSQ